MNNPGAQGMLVLNARFKLYTKSCSRLILLSILGFSSFSASNRLFKFRRSRTSLFRTTVNLGLYLFISQLSVVFYTIDSFNSFAAGLSSLEPTSKELEGHNTIDFDFKVGYTTVFCSKVQPLNAFIHRHKSFSIPFNRSISQSASQSISTARYPCIFITLSRMESSRPIVIVDDDDAEDRRLLLFYSKIY